MDTAIVVGAGSFGASLAWTLARQGVSVTLVDQFEPGDERASSGGETRLMRCSHGSDAEYTRLARRGWELWKKLEAESGESLLVDAGVAWFAHREDGWEAHSERVLRELDIPCERVEGGDLFPSFGAEDVAFTLLEPEAGALRAAKAVRALASQARAHGAHLVRGRARPAGEAVELEDGRRYEAGAVVWACGPWMPLLFPGLITLRVTCQELWFFGGGPGWGRAPAWVDYDLAMYGTGDVDDLGVKAAFDGEGPEIGADDPLPPARPESEAFVRDYLRRRFPALADASVAGSRTCRYELSADTEFIAARHPTSQNVWLLTGGSGHGFKHGPALAEQVAAALKGERELPARWHLGERVPRRSLRTAGSA